MTFPRGAIVAAALLCLAGTAAYAQVTKVGYVPTEKTVCYECHGGGKWNPSLKEFGGITPPATSGAAAGQEFKLPVRFRALWTPRGNDPVLLNSTVSLDLSRAPSLTFGGVRDDQTESTTVSMSLNAQGAGTTVTASQKFLVESGTTDLTFSAIPAAGGAAPPDITLTIDAGAGKVFVVNDGTNGQAETREFLYDELRTLPLGNWTLTVTYDAIVPGNPPTIAPNLDVDLSKHAAFDLQEVREVSIPMPPQLRAGQILIQTWPLVATGDPGANETVTLTFKGTPHYDHASYGDDKDYADFIHVVEGKVVKQADGNLTVVFSQQAVKAEIANGPTMKTVAEAVGYASAFLLVSSIWSGGMFGMASRRQLNRLFDNAKRRVAFHNFLSYGLMAAAIVHMVLFLIEPQIAWTQGFTLGNLAVLCMLLLGVTGALQVQLIKRWGYSGWRWTHYGLAIGAIAFTVVHAVLDGVHFTMIQRHVRWEDPMTELVIGD